MYTWKCFLENIIEGYAIKGNELLFNGVPVMQIPIEVLLRRGVKQLFSWLEEDIDNKIAKYVQEWTDINKEYTSSSTEMITANVIDTIHYSIEQDSIKTKSPQILQINSLIKKGSLRVKQNSQFSENEKAEILIALNYVVENLIKDLVNKDVPKTILEIVQEVQNLDSTIERYSENLLSLAKHVNDFEYYIHQLECQLSSTFEKSHPHQESNRPISFKYIMGLIPPMQSTGFSSLHYMNSAMSNFLFGRDSEKQDLLSFLMSNEKFSFLVVAGPAGIGKSKLVYSFYLDILKSGNEWKCAFINSIILEKLAECHNWNMGKNCLLIYDYAGSSPDLLHKCFSNIALSEEKLNYKIRVILIERSGTKEQSVRNLNSCLEEKVITFPYWYNAVIVRSSREYYPDDYLSKYLYKFLNLNELKLIDYMDLVTTYSKQIYNHSLSYEQKKIIREFAKTQPSKTSRPLFLLAVADVVINGQDISHWNTERIMCEICERDFRILGERITSKELMVNLYDALTYATIFGKWDSSCVFSIVNGCVVDNIAKLLSDSHNLEAVYDWLSTMGLPEDVDLKTQLHIGPYEPDVLGEYFALKHMSANPIALEKWIALIYLHLPQAVPFLKRCGQDYSESSQQKTIKTIINLLVQNDCRRKEQSASILNFLFSLINQKNYRDIVRKCIVIISRTSRSAHLNLNKLILETYDFHGIMSPEDQLSLLNDLSYFYRNADASAVITSKYIEVLGKVAYSNYKKAIFSTDHEAEYISYGDNNSNDIIDAYNERKRLGVEVEEAYISAMCKILSSLYDANYHKKALAIVATVNLEISSIDHERTAIKYLDFYNIIIKNRDHLTLSNVNPTIYEFIKNFDRWKKYATSWRLYALQVASILPHLIEGLFRIQQEEVALELWKSYQWYYSLYKGNAYVEDPQKSSWIWSRRFIAGINRICKAYPKLIGTMGQSSP